MVRPFAALLAAALLALAGGDPSGAENCLGDGVQCGGPGPAPEPPPPAPEPPPPPSDEGGAPEYGAYGYEAEEEYGEWRLFQEIDRPMQRCFWARWKDDRGSLWHYRKVTQRVDWCSNGSTILSYTVSQWSSHGWWCNVASDPVSIEIGGGIGHSSVTILSRGSFTCELPSPLPNPTDWVEVDVRYHADGRREDV